MVKSAHLKRRSEAHDCQAGPANKKTLQAKGRPMSVAATQLTVKVTL